MPDTPAPAFEPITSQEQLDKILGDRLARERAKYSDYGDLKAKAAQFDAAAEAAKTDLQRVTEANAKLAAELAALQAQQLRTEVASSKGHPDLAKFLQGATREELEASAAELIGLTAPHSPPLLPSSQVGHSPTIPSDASEREAARRLFSS